MRRWYVWITVPLLAVGVYFAAIAIADSSHPAPATQAGAASQPATAVVTPAAKIELDASAAAYLALKGLRLEGTIALDADVSGRQQRNASPFTTTFAAPALFRNAVEGDTVVGSTGEAAYVLLTRRSAYTSKAVPKGKLADGAMPDPALTILSAQNPSLLMATALDPAAALTRGYATVDKAADVTIDGVAHPAVVMTNPTEVTTVAFDPVTRLVRRSVTDLRPMMVARGADAVVKAEFVVDYAVVDPAAELPADQFAWTPPENARDVTGRLHELSAGSADRAAAMVGQPAPDFELPTLAGPSVKLSALKGQVVVLDFWATWCAPCLQSLPELSAYNDGLNGRPVKVIAVNVNEPKAKAAALVDRRKWTFTVALDEDGVVAESFGIDGFPSTLVIDQQGIVRSAESGYAPGLSIGKLRETVDAMLK